MDSYMNPRGILQGLFNRILQKVCQGITQEILTWGSLRDSLKEYVRESEMSTCKEYLHYMYTKKQSEKRFFVH